MGIYPVSGMQVCFNLPLDKWRAGSRALRPLVGCHCGHGGHRAGGVLEESKNRKEGS